MSSSDRAGPVFRYHPLTETDMEAFDSLEIGSDAYSFIDGILGFSGREGFSWYLEEEKKKKKKAPASN